MNKHDRLGVIDMTFGSLFAGVGGFDLGLERAGMQCKWQVEIEPFPRRVLEAHWPGLHRPEDVREVGRHNLDPVDLICGGFPCQDVSIAGRRNGLAGERSGLWWEFHRIISELRPRWVLIENVPGLLSSNRGRDMGTILGALGKLGYGWAYRVLDAQFFGVAQRRRRVFIVGCLGDAASAVKVLLEPESSAWSPAPSRKAGRFPSTLSASGAGTSRTGGQKAETDFLVSHTLKAKANDSHDATHDTYVPVGYQGRYDLTHALRAQASRADKPSSSTYVAVGVSTNQRGEARPRNVHGSLTASRSGKQFDGVMVAPTLSTKNEVASSSTQRKKWYEQSAEMFGAVRRLTPLECTRLQGFPDDWLEVEPLGNAEEERAREVLRVLWREAHQEALGQRESGIALALLTPEVLLAGVHGGWLSWEMAERCASAARLVQGEDSWSEGFMRSLRFNAKHRPSPYRQESFEQLARELNRPVSELPLERTQTRAFVLRTGLREKAQGAGLLRHAPSESEEARKPARREDKPVRIGDSPRYKAIGNAVAVPVVEWIGRRIMEVGTA